MSSSYSFENYMSDSFKYLDKIHQHPFLWNYSPNHIYYPNPEYLNTYIPTNQTSHVYIIMFTIETTTVYPFVKFAMTSPNGSMVSAGPPKINSSSSEDEFVIECNKAVLNSFVQTQSSDLPISDLFDDAFRGFITISDAVFAFYDIAPILKHGFQLDNKYRFMTSGEVCESKHKGLQLLNAQTEYPKCILFQPVYLYSAENRNVKHHLAEEIPLPVIAYSVSDVPELTDLDEDYGLYYVFTEKYIGNKNTLHTRYALFLMNHKPWPSMEDGINTYTFTKHGVLHFAVKSPDQFIAL